MIENSTLEMAYANVFMTLVNVVDLQFQEVPQSIAAFLIESDQGDNIHSH